MSLKSINPYTGEIIKSYEQSKKTEIDYILSNAEIAFDSWRKTDINKRAELLKNAANVLRKRKDEFSMLITSEMGKLLTEAKGEVEKSAKVLDYYAENGEEFLKPEKITTEYDISKVEYRPLGTILAIMPWNFPFWQVFRFAAPNLMAGNTAILKHAGNVCGCSLAISDIFKEAGFPEGCFSSVLVSGKDTPPLIADKRIAAVTLTGSTEAGKKVAETAGKHLKKSVLELGGSDPYLILEDADIDLAVEKCVAGRLLNAGQSCIGAKRFIVNEKIYDEFIQKFKTEIKKSKPGNPENEGTSLAPLAKTVFRDDLHKQVTESVKGGAECLTGGYIPDMQGAFYPATILTNVQKGNPAYSEELFGPVASVIKVEDNAEAVNIANDTSFGLGAAVFSKDIEKANYLAAYEINSGAVFINDFVKSDPRMPFGGVKESGYGRELALHGFREFMNVKTVAGKRN